MDKVLTYVTIRTSQCCDLKKCFHCISVCCPHRQLLNGFLQPEADERGKSVVEKQQHDGTDKVIPLAVRVHHELPCVGAVALNNGGDAKYTAETDRHVYEEGRGQNLSYKIRNFECTLAKQHHCSEMYIQYLLATNKA